MKQLAFIGALVVALVAVVALFEQPASALSTPLGQVHAYPISCPASAGGLTLRKATDTQGYSHLTVWNNSATPVYLGGSDVTSSLGMPICTDTAQCPTSLWPMDAKGATCLSSSGTVAVKVMAGTL